MQAAINPVSTTGRQLIHLLQYLHRTLNAHVEVLLNPETEVESMPLRAFYTFAEPHGPLSRGLGPTKAHLRDIPGNRVLTMCVEVPEEWLVEVWDVQAPETNCAYRSRPLFAP